MAGIYDEKIIGLKEQRDFARKLRTRPNDQPMGQMVGGHYVADIGGAISSAIGNIMGGYQEGQATDKMESAQRQKIADTIRYMNQAGIEAPSGLAQQAETPAQSPSMMDRAGALFSGNAQPQGVPAQAYQQNVAKNVDPDAYEKALSGLISVNPEQAAPMAAMYQAKTNRAATTAEREYTHERNRVNDEFNQQKFGIQQANIMQRSQEANALRRDIADLARSNRQAPQGSVVTVVDPNNPNQMISKNTLSGQVYGVSGTEPKAALRQEKEAAAAEKQSVARENFSSELDQISANYNYLNKHGGITNPANSAVSNAGAYLSNLTGPTLGAMGGTANQSARNMIEGSRSRMIPMFKEATGMSSKQMDSNAELKAAKNTLTNPDADYAANMAAINSLKKYWGNTQQPQTNANVDPFEGFTPAQKAEYLNLHGGQ